jgi:hypothetical protein
MECPHCNKIIKVSISKRCPKCHLSIDFKPDELKAFKKKLSNEGDKRAKKSINSVFTVIYIIFIVGAPSIYTFLYILIPLGIIHTLIILASNNSNQEIESPKLSEGEEKRIKKARTKKTESVIIRAVLILLIVLMIVALILLSSDV